MDLTSLDREELEAALDALGRRAPVNPGSASRARPRA
jgi:hypothetical protein